MSPSVLGEALVKALGDVALAFGALCVLSLMVVGVWIATVAVAERRHRRQLEAERASLHRAPKHHAAIGGVDRDFHRRAR